MPKLTQYELILLRNKIEALTAERDAMIEGWSTAKKLAMQNALERDALKDAARLALDALEQLHTIDTETEIVTIWVEDEIAALKAVL